MAYKNSYEILQDLSQLYCVTNNKKVEDEFIKLSQIMQEDIIQWTRSNANNNVLRKKMRSPDVLTALVYLIELNNSNMPKNQLLQRLLFNSDVTKYIPIYKSFLNLLSSDLRNILFPFQEILRPFASVTPTGYLSDSDVAHELRVIENEYNRHMAIIEDQNKPLANKKKPRLSALFGYLLEHFTNDILESLSDSPNTRLKQLISQHNLPNIELISSALNYSTPKFLYPYIKKIATEAIRDFKRTKDPNYNYIFNQVRNQTMNVLGFVSAKELQSYVIKETIDNDFSKYIGGGDPFEESKGIEQNKYPFNPTLIRNERNVAFVSLLLYYIFIESTRR